MSATESSYMKASRDNTELSLGLWTVIAGILGFDD